MEVMNKFPSIRELLSTLNNLGDFLKGISVFSGQMGNGTMNYDDSNTGKWSPVAPGTVNEILWKIACGKQ